MSGNIDVLLVYIDSYWYALREGIDIKKKNSVSAQ